jgi:hypothetical protein
VAPDRQLTHAHMVAAPGTTRNGCGDAFPRYRA